MEEHMKKKTIIAALVLASATVATPLAAQEGRDWRSGSSWNSNSFWQGAPQGLQQRIDWLQQRINRGVQDGSLDRREARRVQRQLDYLRQQADSLNRNLDDLSRSIRWASRNDRYGSGYGDRGRDPYATDYDAARYYRDDPRYTERRLGPNDEVYRGSDGRYYCKRSDGTTGLIVGGAGGALLGNVIDGGHNRVAGTLIGGALGALLGKSIDQNSSDVRCR
jgi:hypothetical protein